MSSAAIDVTFGQPSLDAVDALDPLFTNMESDVADRVNGALYAGLLNGTNPHELAGQLVDCLSPARATTIARTEMLGAYRTSALDAYRANSDVVGQWMWSSARGGACIACLEMDGETFSLDEEMDGMTHPNCRCSPIPITSSWGDILGPLGIDSSDIADVSILDDYQTGAEWFAQQDAQTQIDALGSKAAYEAVQAGEVAPRDFVGVRHDEQYGDSIYTKSLKEALSPTFNPAAVEEYQQSLTELDQLLAELRAPRVGMDERAALDALNADDVVPKAANRLGGVDSRYYRMTIDGRDYFVKVPREPITVKGITVDFAKTARVADDAAQLLGMNDLVVPTRIIENDAGTFVISPWVDGTQMSSEAEMRAAVQAMSAQDVQREALYEYLLGDTDRSLGGYLLTPDGSLRAVDFEGAFDRMDGLSVNNLFRLAAASDDEFSQIALDRAVMQDFLDQTSALRDVSVRDGLSDTELAAYDQRVQLLRDALEQDRPAVYDLISPDYRKYFADTSQPFDRSNLVTIGQREAGAVPRIGELDKELRDAQAALQQAVQSGAGRQDVLAAQWDVANKQAAVDLENGGRGVKIIVRGADPLDNSKLDQSMQDLFGRNLSRDEIGGLVGAPQGSYIEVYPGNDGLAIITHGPDYDPMAQNEASFNSIRYISRDPATGDLMASNTSFAVRDDLQGQGLGARIFADQVDTLSKLDVRYIETQAAGSGTNFTFGGPNGYYTWPRFGYDGPLPAEAIRIVREAIQAGDLPQSWAGFRSISDVMQSPGGQDWWKANGVPLHLRFDLTDGSYSRQTLEEYLKQRGLA